MREDGEGDPEVLHAGIGAVVVTGRTPALGIDARKIRDYGIGRYLEGLLGGLAETNGPERFVLFVANPDRAALPGRLPELLAPERFRLVGCDAPLYSLRELFTFRGAARRHGIDLLHFPHYVRGFNPGCPVGVTIHDAIHLSHPPSRPAALYARIMIGWAARSADVLFADTAAARDDIAARTGVDAARFRVVPLAAGAEFAPPAPEDVARYRKEHGLGEDFVLVVASHRPHKNFAGAVAAFARAALPEAALVAPARDDAAGARLAQLSAGPLTVLQPVTDDDLPLLYAAARIVWAPSLAEGYGLPPLEAAACGAAVLATGILPHREVLGDAAAFSDSGSPDDMARALTDLWNDELRLEMLRRRGPRRASELSWRRTAELTLEGWRALLAGDVG